MLAAMFAAFLLQIVFRYALNLPDRLDARDQRRPLGLAGSVGRGLRRQRARGNPLRHHLRRRRARSTPGDVRHQRGVALVALYLVSLPAVVDYVTFMKVRAQPI